ncbi:MAG: DUF882 domain-containing protein [Kiloniellales bacterium]|nr:DUF882 domain-containing protein [Kiloniellales bacterium]
MLFHETTDSRPVPGRRACLRGLVGLTGGLALGALPLSGSLAAARLPEPRKLSFQSLHTGERLTATYFRDGRYDPLALAEIDELLRDWRSGEVRPMDRALLDQLAALQEALGSGGTFEVISGYRSPTTNGKLAAQSSGVAKRSLHMRGRAIDVRLSDRRLAEVHDAALRLRAGGVGLYTRSDFLHLDTGRVRRWGR